MSGKQYTTAEVREAFVAGWLCGWGERYPPGEKELARAEALRRHPDKEDKR